MKKIEYINKLVTENRLNDGEYSVVSSLIYCLSPEDACNFFDLTFNQDYRVRRYVLRKIQADISKEYLSVHKKLISSLLNLIDEKGFSKKESCAFSLDSVYDSLPKRHQKNVLNRYLTSKYGRNRDRGYKRLNLEWDKKFQNYIVKAWQLYHDSNCLKLIINHFPIDFLLDNHEELMQYAEPYQLSKLFIQIASMNVDLLKKIKETDQISYAYVLAKLDMKLSDVEAQEILHKNYQDQRIGLLLWCFGKMELWDTIVEYDQRYRKLLIIQKRGN